MAKSVGSQAAAPIVERPEESAPPVAGSAGPLSISTAQWGEALSSDERAGAFWEAWGGLKPSRRLAVVREIAARGDRRSRKLLAAALWDDKSEVALAAIEGLDRLGDPSAAASLEEVASITRASQVAAEAGSAAAKLRALRVRQTKEAAASPGTPECWASFVDGDGAQLLMAVRPAVAGNLRLSTVSLSDRRGLVEAWGSESVTPAEVEALRSAGARRSAGEPSRRGGARRHRPESAAEQRAGDRRGPVRDESFPEIGWVRVDAAYCRAAIDAALLVNRRDHRRLPGSWEFWRDSFERAGDGGLTAADDRAVPEATLRRRLLQTASLVHFEGFRSWLILGEDLAPFLRSARQGFSRDAEETEAAMSEVVSACLAAVIRPPQRRLWRERLLRQAALWQRRGDRIVSELCLAAAWGLDQRNGVPSEEHPLLRAMTRISLEIAMGG